MSASSWLSISSLPYLKFPINSLVDIMGLFDCPNQLLHLYIDGNLASTSDVSANKIVFNDSDDHNLIGAGWSDSQTSFVNFWKIFRPNGPQIRNLRPSISILPNFRAERSLIAPLPFTSKIKVKLGLN